MMQNLMRRATDTVVDGLNSTAPIARQGIDMAKQGANTVYRTAVSYPKTAAGTLLGIGLAAAALWMLSQPSQRATARRAIAGRGRAMRRSARPRRARAARAASAA
jgi:hypothetical protein